MAKSGLHGDLINFIESSREDENMVPPSHASHNLRTGCDLSNLFYRDLLNHDTVNIVNELVDEYGSREMRSINTVLNLWHRNWLNRRIFPAVDLSSRRKASISVIH